MCTAILVDENGRGGDEHFAGPFSSIGRLPMFAWIVADEILHFNVVAVGFRRRAPMPKLPYLPLSLISQTVVAEQGAIRKLGPANNIRHGCCCDEGLYAGHL